MSGSDTAGSAALFLGARNMDDEEAMASGPAAERKQGFWRAACWTVCSAAATYTTKQLMVTHNYHYPLTIALRSVVSMALVYVALLRIYTEPNVISGVKRRQWGLRQSEGNDFLLNRHWIPMIPASLAAAASFPMLMEGILHMPSLSVLVMLFPVIYIAESVVLFICCAKSRSQKSLPWEAVVSTAASSTVLFNEYRLMVPGLIWGVSGILLMGFSRACFVLGSERAGSSIAVQARLKTYHGFVCMTLLFGLLFCGVPAYYMEHFEPTVPLTRATWALILVNLLAITGTAFSGTSLLAYTPISFEDPTPEFSNIPVRGVDFLASSSSSLWTLLVTIHSSPISNVSWVQIAAYLIASACLVGIGQMHGYILACVEITQQQMNKSRGNERQENRRASRVLTLAALFILLLVSGWTVSSFASASINSLPQSFPMSTFDTAYIPTERFEIVVSMYKEDTASVKTMLTSLKHTTLLSTLKPRVIVYTKDPDQDLYALKKATGADIVERLDNTGREGGTYLWHIVNKWDELAEQTMFIQAHAHNMRELIPRINSYLVPATGMLSLGFTGVTCACGSCSDRWGWEDKWGVIPALYEKIYSQPCRRDEPILLSYKGQFVVSARRIRGVGIKTFAGLLTTITSPRAAEGGIHPGSDEMKGVGTEADSSSNPFFGFTVERLWGLVMQCATDAGVAARCPSLLSGMGYAGKVEDCQCLDAPASYP
ncbi:uncharacterized protein L3040_000936 [Drepanopeziza brunnea f. sp. 'multigermtubi']|uniref:Uncharacterized protein n=1 Tax=Marssonina brunnea f. sp. multigermtubi (strain MB_m1) TaxID=1072389 RepID=K1X6W9_MARBU|nr:uncharacterized protein MBM_01513 [Drepanopeziza brunnea f. sp. 'multigermtubi' MB_m1]EKD20831.1 hypothetical protein MBM_01513 [Drepanopeziza brunnea f. sp. 'multigermtubi' MB_m1]KAJ5054670.1 hypothetical protein L3040_000936 [Drepanopeziza brunnea f. sp. 'multigermtubi']